MHMATDQWLYLYVYLLPDKYLTLPNITLTYLLFPSLYSFPSRPFVCLLDDSDSEKESKKERKKARKKRREAKKRKKEKKKAAKKSGKKKKEKKKKGKDARLIFILVHVLVQIYKCIES